VKYFPNAHTYMHSSNRKLWYLYLGQTVHIPLFTFQYITIQKFGVSKILFSRIH